MPGILGIVQAGTRLETANRFMQNMLEPLIHFPWYQWAKEHWRGATLGIVSLGTLTRTPHCLKSDNERYLLAFEGELYNADALQKELSLGHLPGDAAEIQATVVLHAMQQWGAGALNRFNGLFQLAWWDAQQQELIVAGDRGGLRPIYFAHQQDRFAFAPEVKALLTLPWVSREIDYQGLLSFLRHGLPLGQHTFFLEVKVMPPGAFAVFRQGRLQIERYWKMDAQEKPQPSEKEIRRQFIDTWTEVMRDQSGGDFRLGLPLSGGLDSRLILAALSAQKKEVFTFTMGIPGCKDAEIAQRLAETTNNPNLFSPIVPNEFAMGLEHSVYLTDGMFNCFHANVRRLLPSLVDTVNMVYDGITPLDSLYDPEDLLWRKIWRQNNPTRWLHAEVDNADVRRFPLDANRTVDLIDAAAQGFFHHLHTRDFLDEFVQVQQLAAAETTAVVDLFWVEEFQHRFFAFGAQILRTAVEVRCPFFDKRMLDLIGTLAPAQRSSDKPLQRYAIHALQPVLARIPWERTGLPLLAGCCKTFLRRAFRALRRKAQTFMQRQFGRAPQKSDADKTIDYDEMIRTSPELQQQIVSILIEQWEEGSRLFDRENLQTLIDQHLARAGNYADMIGRILTVEIWHRQFVRFAKRQAHSYSSQRERAMRLAA
jgi:asparagine synthase (glutamine-hydrolysing)